MSNPNYYQLNHGYYTWENVIDIVLTHPAHTEIIVEFWMVPPLPNYFTSRPADASGQIDDYGVGLEDGKGIHVKQFENCWTIHWDKKDPNQDPLGHLYHDAPHWLAILGIGILVAGVGYFASKE